MRSKRSWALVRVAFRDCSTFQLTPRPPNILACMSPTNTTENNSIFAEMVVGARDRLSMLTFGLLAPRALEGREM